MSVTTSAGLFPVERTVSFDTLDGIASAFVLAARVDESKKTMQVNVIDQDEKIALIQFPSQDGVIVATVKQARLSVY
jgi:hypothetical protein